VNVVERSVLNLYLDPRVRVACQGHLSGWMFGEDWVGQFIRCLDQNKYDGRVPEAAELVMELHTAFGIGRSDCETVADIVLRHKSPKSYEDAMDSAQSWIQQAHITNGVEIIAAGNDADYRRKGVESITYGATLQLSADSFFDFSDVDSIEAARQDDFPDGSHVIQSAYQLVNKASAYGGYKYGDLVMVAAESGVGKSTLMCHEMAHQAANGYKAAYFALGDMTEYDLFIKLVSNLAGVDSEALLTDGYQRYMTPVIVEALRNIRVKSLPPDQLDVYQLLSKASQLRQNFQFDLLVVDYDANIKESTGLGNSYMEGGTVYANLKGYGKGKCVVMVGSQTKIQYWGEELVRKSYANDSSKKQHHVDIMLGLGRNKECPLIGKLNIAKMRRGKTDVWTHVALDNAKGRIPEVRKSKYERRLQEYKIANGGDLVYELEDAE